MNKELSYNELINGLIDGSLKSPQVYGESFYINLRITGTGITDRYVLNDNKEVVLDKNGKPETYQINRSEEEFLSDKFLEACNSIPVLIEHPDSANQLLNGKNYKSHNVGIIVKSFIKDKQKEVWGVARILDPKVLVLINEKLKSTSPAITSKNIKDKNGLVNEIFEYIDHLALVVDGYWDDYSDKAIQIDSNKKAILNIKEDKMAELDKTKEEEKKPEDNQKVDNLTGKDAEDDKTAELNAKLDAIMQRLDSVEKQLDSSKSAENNKADEGDKTKESEYNKEGSPLDEANKKIDLITSRLDTLEKVIAGKQEADKVDISDINKDLNQDDLKEVLDAEEEEEKATLVDNAYNMHLSYKEDGLKCPKLHARDSKESYLRRFLLLNKEKVGDKFKGFVENLTNKKLEKNEYAIAVDSMKSIKDVFDKKALEKQAEAKKGFKAEQINDKQKVYHNAI